MAIACDSLAGPEPAARVPGILEYGIPEAERDSARLGTEAVGVSAPDTVAVNELFRVYISTWGDPCWVQDGATIVIEGMTADVAPYDRRRPGLCSMVSRLLPHHVLLSFPQPGTVTLRVAGRRVLAGQEPERTVLTRRIVVR